MLGVQRKMNLIAVVPDLILILCSVFLFVQSAIIMRDDSTENVSKLNWQLYIAIVRKLALCYVILYYSHRLELRTWCIYIVVITTF